MIRSPLVDVIRGGTLEGRTLPLELDLPKQVAALGHRCATGSDPDPAAGQAERIPLAEGVDLLNGRFVAVPCEVAVAREIAVAGEIPITGKVAVSRHAVRFLFEVGPEHAEKTRWAAAWKKNAPRLAPVLRRVKGLAWFKNEHDEEPAAPLADLSTEQVAELADELTRTRDGQLVLGRVVPAADAARWTEAQYRNAALETFRALAPLYRLR